MILYMRCKAFETLTGTVGMHLCANVYPIWIFLSLFSFYRIAIYPKVLMLEGLRFSHTTGSLVLWWVHDATIRSLLKCFAPTSVFLCKHLFCNALWLWAQFCCKNVGAACFETRSVATGEHSGAVPPKFLLCPPNFCVPRKVCFKNIIKTKIVAPKNAFCPTKA